MTGQDAVATAEAFHQTLALDGVILTKVDGDARGGAALSVKEVVGRPDRLHLHGREAGRLRAVPPRPHGRPDPRHGRRAHAHREGRAARRPGPGRGQPVAARSRGVSPSRTSSSRCSRSRRWGPCPDLVGMIPGLPKELRNAEIDDGLHGPDRGHHPLHDARGAPEPARSSTAPAVCASPTAAARPPPRSTPCWTVSSRCRRYMRQMAGHAGSRGPGRPAGDLGGTKSNKKKKRGR